jgi:gliding motility-associated protein GldC
MHKTDIKIDVSLDENKIPESLQWSAPDGGIENQAAKAMILALWDPNTRETLRIDLWTKDMPVDDMKIFFHQTLVGMADTYERATEDQTMADTLRDFCEYVAEKLNLKS